MNLERTFVVAQPEAVVAERARNFLSAAGYQAVSLSPVRYKRGTLFGSLASISPKKWQAQASVEVAPSGGGQTTVALKLDVNTKGHIITQKEVAYWQTEVESFERAVSVGDVNAGGLDDAVAAVTKSVWKGFLVFVLVALGVGVPVGLLASRINRSFSVVGIVIGICAGLAAARKHWGY
jgi:hypothetical protein